MKSFLLSCFVLLIASSILIGHDDTSDQVAAVARQIKQNPRNAELYLQRGELYRQMHNWTAALSDYDQASKLDPEMSAVDLCRGLLFLRMDQPEKAKVVLDRFLQVQPGNVTARLARARAFARLHQNSEAISDYSFVVQHQPEPEYYLERAELLANQSENEEALRGLDEGIEKLGPLVTLELYAIELELRLKRHDSALSRLEKIADQTSRKETWLSKRANILEQAGRPSEAREDYLQALAALNNLPATRRNSKSMVELESQIRAALRRIDPVTNFEPLN